MGHSTKTTRLSKMKLAIAALLVGTCLICNAIAAPKPVEYETVCSGYNENARCVRRPIKTSDDYPYCSDINLDIDLVGPRSRYGCGYEVAYNPYSEAEVCA